MTMRINAPPARRTGLKTGRRAGLDPSTSEPPLQTWIDDAIDRLALLSYSCTFDVVRDYPDGLPPSEIGRLLGVSEQAADKEIRNASQHFREHAVELGADEIAQRCGLDDATGLAFERAPRKAR